MAAKQPVDNSEFYQSTEYHIRDGIYNWIVRRYGIKGNRWTKSDTVVWYGFTYHVWPWVPTLIFLYFVYLVTNYTFEHYGWFKGITVLAVMMLVRLNTVVRKLDQLNRTMGGK